MAKNNGHIFEQEFKKSAPEDVYIKKLKVSGMNYKGGGNEGDYLVYKYPLLYIFELKSHKGVSIPFSKLREVQVKGLQLLAHTKGVITGFVFNFRDLDKTYFIDIEDIVNYMIAEERKSFPIEWVESVGVKIDSKKVRVRYTYNLLKLLNTLEER